MYYDTMPLGDLVQVLKDRISRRSGLRQSWSTVGGRPIVTLTKKGSGSPVAIEVNDEYFIVQTADGYWSIEWAAPNIPDEQSQTFDELLDDLTKYLEGRYQVEVTRGLFGRTSRFLKIGGPDGGRTFVRRKRGYFPPDVLPNDE